MFGNPETTTGGRALKFYASVRLDIRRIETIKNGQDVDRQPRPRQGRQEQGRAAVPAGRVRHHVQRRHLQSPASVLDVGVELGIVEKSGAWFYFGEERLGQGRENAKEFLKAQSRACFEDHPRPHHQRLARAQRPDHLQRLRRRFADGVIEEE